MLTKTQRIGLLTGIMGLSACLSLYSLGSSEMSGDGITHLLIAQSRGADFARLAFYYEPTSALYYVVLHVWQNLGSEEFTVRLLSAIFAVATVPLVYALGTRLFDPPTGIVAILLLATNATVIAYAREAGSYAMVVFLAMCSYLLFLKCVDTPYVRNWSAYVFVTALVCSAHTLGLLLVGAQWSSLPFFRPRRDVYRRFFVSSVAVGVLVLPLAILIVLGNVGQVAWIPKTSLRRLVDLGLVLAGSIRGPRALRWPLAALYAVGLTVACFRFRNAWLADDRAVPGYALTIAGVMVPILLLILVSLFKPLMEPDYLLICLPFLCLSVAAGFSYSSARWLGTGLIAIMLVFSLCKGVYNLRHLKKPVWKNVASYILSNAKPGDRIIFIPAFCRLSYDHNSERVGASDIGPVIAFPKLDASLRVDGKYYVNGELMKAENPLVSAALSRKYQRLWVLTCDQEERDITLRQLATLQREYDCSSRHDVENVAIRLYSSCSPPASGGAATEP